MNRKRQMSFMLAMAGAAALSGCRQDMHNQPKYIPLRASEFFADGSSARQPVIGAVSRGHIDETSYLYTGKINGADGNVMPFPVTKAVLLRGEERYNIYCSPCHSRIGDGNGMIVQRGYRRAANLHDPRLQTAALGHFYDVIANGWGAMPDYSAQMDIYDRWSVVAYIRALQLSQNATVNEVPADLRNQIHTRAQIEAGMGAGEQGEMEHGLTSTPGATGPSQGNNRSAGPMTPTTGGTDPNRVSRDYNEQSGGQDIQSARPNPPGQLGHPGGGDSAGIADPRGKKGADKAQTALPQGSWQSGPTQSTPQEGQFVPQGDSREPK